MRSVNLKKFLPQEHEKSCTY